MAIQEKIITKDEAIIVWESMLNNKRRIPATAHFIDFLLHNKINN